MRIAVAGGTGTVGREVVTRARARGHEVTVVARSTGADVLTGAGLDEAIHGAETVIDVLSVGTLKPRPAIEFFRTAASQLLSAAKRAGVPHAVVLSIVGIDRDPYGYYAGKITQEAVYETADVPWSLVRATQFHEFAGQVATQARFGPVQLAPRARIQPIAAAEVAEQLVSIAESAPGGRLQDIAGPREEELSEMIRSWTRAQGQRGRVLAVSLPDAQMRGMRAGHVLPGADARLLGPTFDEWLNARPRA